MLRDHESGAIAMFPLRQVKTIKQRLFSGLRVVAFSSVKLLVREATKRITFLAVKSIGEHKYNDSGAENDAVLMDIRGGAVLGCRVARRALLVNKGWGGMVVED